MKKLFTNEAFLGVLSLTILGCFAIYHSNVELAGVAIGGIAALLRGEKGEK